MLNRPTETAAVIQGGWLRTSDAGFLDTDALGKKSMGKHLDGKIVTSDYNLNKVARLHGVEVVNLNELANALKPLFLPGESVEVRVVKRGEEAGQGVGYLDDGTMIVVEGGREHINENVKVTVTSMLQKSAGRMVFAKFEGPVPATV